MIRILQMIGSLKIGGSQSLIMNIYRNIDRSIIQFDFIVDRIEYTEYAKEIETLGGIVYIMPTFKGTNVFQVRKAWKIFFEQHKEYKVLHSHVRSYASLYIPIAKKYGVTVIVHSHSTSNGHGLMSVIKKIMQYPIRFQADYFFGCSKASGMWLFGEEVIESDKFYIIPNAINLKKYEYDETRREQVRAELGINDELLFGHVGRMHEAKNHFFLLEIFSALYKKNPNSKLLLIGDGELRGDIKGKISELGLSHKVMLLGTCSNVPTLLQGIDIFLLPSKWEGLPVSVIEAQAAGLPCFISDKITEEVGVSKLVHYLPIDKGYAPWVEGIEKTDLQRQNVKKEIIKAGFDIEKTTKWLTSFYRKLSLYKDIYYK